MSVQHDAVNNMERYINANALKGCVNEKAHGFETLISELGFSMDTCQVSARRVRNAYQCCEKLIDAAPPVDVAPVRHAHWKEFTRNDVKGLACSDCDTPIPIGVSAEKMQYCYRCGARMDGVSA